MMIAKLLLAAVITIAISSTAPADNPVLNGGFETGDVTGWTFGPGSSVASAGTFTGLGPLSGEYYAALSQNGGAYNVISQTITDTPGEILQLSFSFASAGSCVHCQVVGFAWNPTSDPHGPLDSPISGGFNQSGAYSYFELTRSLVGTGSDTLTIFASSFCNGGSAPTPGCFDLGAHISIDKVSLIQTGIMGTVDDTQPIVVTPVALSVPGPIVGAGLPSLVMAFVGLFAWRRRKALAV